MSATSPLFVSFTWTPNQIYWAGMRNNVLISTKMYAGSDVPSPDTERIHMNLWLYRAKPNAVAAPQNGKTATVVLSNFVFTPNHD